jgi:predicted PhzF superfamily epimerase YddE/YHI9/menaquinone-dependent protoporphyrinogen IX oxidase
LFEEDENGAIARIFTEDEELLFAGHPVLGAAAVLHQQHRPQDSAATWIVRVGGRPLTVHTHRTDRPSVLEATMNQGSASTSAALTETQRLDFAVALNVTPAALHRTLPAEVISTGLPYLVLPVTPAGLAMSRISVPDLEERLETVGAKFVYVLDPEQPEGRTWDNDGRVEDVATGSAAGPAERSRRSATGSCASPERGRTRKGPGFDGPCALPVRVCGHQDEIHHRWEVTMRVLVTYATRHASTAGIAEAIGHVLSATAAVGSVEVLPVEDVDEVEDYDAVLLGSAIYDGRWLKSARRFVRANTEALSNRPVWLFSSGPIGAPPMPDTDIGEVTALAELIQAQGHKLFAGQLRLADLRLAERSNARQVHAVQGDYRDWDLIRAWATDIATCLTPSTST